MSEDLLERLKAFFSGRYAVEGELDRGGMAVVYLARDVKHDRTVAIKVLDPALSATLGTERFLREIEVVARLQHPNILTLIDSGEVEGLPYYVMPFVKGQSLATLLEREGPLPVEQAVRIGCEVAGALETAHRHGVIHRDIKPSNVLLSEGHAVVADFGIAAALDEAKLGRLTRTGISLGSPIYMSPEQASGERDLDGRTDVYALGCMLYEMLGGEAPFGGSLESVVSRKLLGEIPPLKELRRDVPPGVEKAISKALARERDKRFATAAEFREALLAALPGQVPKGWGRRRTLATAAVVAVVAVGALLAIYRVQKESQRALWATQTLAEVERLANAGHLAEALALAREVEAVFPRDTTLARLYPRFSFTVPIRTDPPGARVYIQDMADPEGAWELLGTTPLEEARFAGVTFDWGDLGTTNAELRPHRLRFELDGHRARELLTTAVLGVNYRGIPPMDPVVLEPQDPALEGMVRLPGFTFNSIDYADFHMDRYEVTNRAFKEFVDAGGYRNPEYWLHPFVRGREELEFGEAMALFVDQTGRPGPSTWRVGTFPEGQEDYPVGGVSWYEAAAYARWVGKELPTTLQWSRGLLYYRDVSHVVEPRSNLGSAGPRPVGQGDAMTTLGVYDLVGNVREWCFNEVGEGERATRGAGWPDAPFHAMRVIPKPAFDRDATHGFRLIKAFDDEEALVALRRRVSRTTVRDFRAERPVPDGEFEVFQRLYAYDPYPLRAMVERVDTLEQWIREVVAFDVPYGERGGAALYLPRDKEGPFQPILFWGATGIYLTRSVDEEWTGPFDFMVQAGRAVVVPIFKGAYGRDMPPAGTYGGSPASSAYRDATIQWVKDLSATVDYLETRADLEAEKLGYYGLSHGGYIVPIVMAVESRVRASVTNVGGLWDFRFFPEADPFNFLPRARSPLLMINGRYDIVYPYETSQLPMFELLGTPQEDKRHYVSPAAHIVPRDEVIRETLAWFDKYLGEPGG